MTGKRRLTKSIKGLDVTKQDKPSQIRGILGNIINGNQVVEVPTRPGYVWVRLRDQQSEIIQAFNDDVSPVYDLPVFVTRDSDDPTRYIIVGRDTAQYANWGAGAAYLPRHANQHSFSDDAGAAGDVVWVYGRQFMPMLAYPSGSAGAGNVIISPYTYFSQAQDWVYSGGTGTASIVAYKPTGSNARVVLVYMDTNGNPQLLPGDYFASTITGTSQVIQYLPDLPNNTKPIAAVRLVSGTSIINWSNIYDVRQFYNDSVVAPITPSLGLAIYDDHVFKVTGTAIDFTDNISVAVTGSFVYVSSTGGGGGGSGTGTVGARVYREQDQLIPRLTGTAIAFTHEHYDTDNIHSGSSTQLYCNTPGYYAIIGNAIWQAADSGYRELRVRLNGNNAKVIGKVGDNVAGTSNPMAQCVTTIWQLDQGDYVELIAYHEYSSSLVVVGEAGAPNYSTEFMMQRFGDVGSTIISTGTVVVNNTYNTYNANNVLPIFDNGAFKVTGTAVSFDDNLTVIVSGTMAFISSSAAGGGGGLSALPIQDDGSFVVSGTALSFDKDLIVTASGTVAHVEVPAGTFASGSHTHPAGATAIQIYEDSVYKATGTAISFNDNLNVIVSGTVAFINSIALDWFNVKDYGAVGDEATDDTVAFSNAISALNSAGRGVLYIPAGSYRTSGSFQLTVPFLVRGDGNSVYGDTSSVSKVLCTKTDATLFSVGSYVGKFSDIALVCSGTASAGAGISVSGSFLAPKIDFDHISVRGFYDNIDIQVGHQWLMNGCYIADPIRYGTRIRNIVNADAGDWSIDNSGFYAGDSNADAAIRIESSGGGKITNVKINTESTSFGFNHGIDLTRTSGADTSVLLIDNVSIENFDGNAININTSGGAGYLFININNLQVGSYDNTDDSAIDINAGTLGDIVGVNINQCIFRAFPSSSVSAISLTNIDRVYIGKSITNYGYTSVLSHSGCTNLNIQELNTYTDSIWNAKGDLVVGSGSSQAGILPVGTNDFVLTADNTQPLGIKWAASSAGGGLGAIPVYNENAFVVSGTALIFNTDLDVAVTGTFAYINSQASGGGTGNKLPIYDDSVFKITGTAISFDNNISVAVTGTVAFVSSTGGSVSDIGARVYRSTGTALSIGVETPIPFDSERWDTDSMHSGTSTQLYFNTAGKYVICGSLQYSASNSGVRITELRLNGSTYLAVDQRTAASAGETRVAISTLWDFDIGDYVELVAYSSVTSISVQSSANHSPELSAQKIA